MDLKEIGQMSPDEEMAHWWIQTRFQYLDQAVLASAGPAPLQVLEVGCGTCQNLRYLRTLTPHQHQIGRLVGVDLELDPKRIDTSWAKPGDWFGKCLEEVPAQAPSSFDLLIAMDVLEHIDDDRGALKRWIKELKPGGLVFATVPAFPSLWSQHDVLLDHKRRYTRPRLQELALSVGLEVVRTRYAFSHIFPLVYGLRKAPRPKASQVRSSTELQRTPGPLNSILCGLGKLEARAGGNPWFGTSVVGLFKKPGLPHV